MSRRRRRRPSRGPAVAVVLVVLLAGAAIALHRLYPRKVIGSRGPVYPGASRRGGAARSQPARPARTLTARLYFARIVNGQERLTPIAREVSSNAPAQAAVEELISGELPEGCTRPLPKDTVLRSVRVRDGLATADFSGELVSSFQGGSDNEGVAVYSIVNTLTSLPIIKRVQILVDGKRADSIGGHLDVSGPLSADGELVVQ